MAIKPSSAPDREVAELGEGAGISGELSLDCAHRSMATWVSG